MDVFLWLENKENFMAFWELMWQGREIVLTKENVWEDAKEIVVQDREREKVKKCEKLFKIKK